MAQEVEPEEDSVRENPSGAFAWRTRMLEGYGDPNCTAFGPWPVGGLGGTV